MTEWRDCKFGEIATFSYGKMPNKKNIVNCGYPIFSGYKIVGYYNSYMYEDPQLIIVARGVGGTGDVKISPPKSYITNLSIIAEVHPGKANKKFLYYYFKINNLRELDSGSAQSQITINDLNNYCITLPPLPEQKAIAEVLSSLDDKIDLLTRQNKTLEDLAQAYFRKWFIEDASSEWEVGKLGDEFNITMGQSPKGETYNDLKIGLPFFQGKAEFGFRFPLEKQYCSEPIKIADKFDTLLSVRAPVGALNMALYKCCIGRGLAIPIHKKGYKHYTFYKMKSLQELFNTFDDDGTVFGSISREKFLSIDNVIPPEKLVCYFDNFAKYFDLKIYENTVQIRTLSKLRDTLLPKLISGEVRVNI